VTRAFLEGAVAGYGIAIPVGAIAVLIVDTGLRQGFGSAVWAGAGAATADLIYASLAAMAGSALSERMTSIQGEVRIISGLVLLLIAARSLLRVWRGGNGSLISQTATPGAIYLRLVGLTLANPMTIAYFSALILGEGTSFAPTTSNRMGFVAGAALASLSWQTFLAGIGAIAHHRLPPRLGRVAGWMGSLIIAGFAIRILLG